MHSNNKKICKFSITSTHINIYNTNISKIKTNFGTPWLITCNHRAMANNNKLQKIRLCEAKITGSSFKFDPQKLILTNIANTISCTGKAGWSIGTSITPMKTQSWQ